MERACLPRSTLRQPSSAPRGFPIRSDRPVRVGLCVAPLRQLWVAHVGARSLLGSPSISAGRPGTLPAPHVPHPAQFPPPHCARGPSLPLIRTPYAIGFQISAQGSGSCGDGAKAPTRRHGLPALRGPRFSGEHRGTRAPMQRLGCHAERLSGAEPLQACYHGAMIYRIKRHNVGGLLRAGRGGPVGPLHDPRSSSKMRCNSR